MSEDLGVAVAIAVTTMSAGGLCNLVVRSAATGALVAGGALGIRTRATRATPTAWMAGHRAALVWVRAGWAAGSVIALAALVLAVAGAPASSSRIVALAAPLALLALVAVAGVVADRAARDVGRSSPPER